MDAGDCCADVHIDRKTHVHEGREEEKPTKTCQPVTCAEWQGVLSSVEKAIRTDNFTVEGSSRGYYGCKVGGDEWWGEQRLHMAQPPLTILL